MKAVRLAVVDDSAFIRKALSRVFENEPAVTIVGSAASGEELVSNIASWNPDIVTLDLSMPGMGGLATLDAILAWKPIPVVILSTHSSRDAPLTIEALHRGAVDFIDKQEISLVDFSALRAILLEKIRQFVGEEPSPPPAPAEPPQPLPESPRSEEELPGDFSAVVIGASTGGPPAIQRLLEDLGPPPVPIAIVQHMPLGFTRAFAERLNAHLPMSVREAADGEPLSSGTVVIAPSGKHLRLRLEGERLQSALAKTPEDVPHRPSIDVLFESAASVLGRRTLAVLLTGMGRDGADGMARLHAAGAFTIAQDEASSIVYGMPRAAWDLGAVLERLPIDEIGRRLASLLAIGRPRGPG